MPEASTAGQSEEGLLHAHRLEALGQLAGGVAHDFNNIMTAVVGFAELALVRMPPGGEQLRPYLEEIKRAGERAGEIAHQLLAFSRKQVLQMRVFDVNALVEQVEALLEPLLADDIELVCRLDPELAHVEADPAQIEQVLINLAVNASDAMPRGGRLTIETANVQLDLDDASRYLDVPPGAYVRIAVTDTGVGMDAATMELIFEPFFTTKDVGEGTGLGLATVFGIVKQSGGDIGVSSRPGRGSTFKVYLPCVQASLDAPLEDVFVGEPPGGSETILLVDDEELVRSFEREVLLDGGYTVLEASSPRYALALSSAHSGAIDLLVTDVVMPRMSGRELAEAIAGDRPGIKTLYVSGYPSGAITRHGVLEHGIAFLPKPLTRHALAHKVREVLDA